MDTAHIIFNYFPDLNKHQQGQISKLRELYQEWNSKINVISRKDMDNFYINHCLHSLGIAKVYRFKKEEAVIDVGTGGGFPGIPLAIMFPETKFTLIDAIGKKIRVVDAVVDALELTNISTIHGRAEKIKGKYDFVVSRAVTRMKTFYDWTKPLVRKSNSSDQIKNGILYLKGGDLQMEMSEVPLSYQSYKLSDFFKEDFFETKQVIHLPFP